MIRQLEPRDWVKLQPMLIREFAEGLPDPANTRIFVIEEEEKTIGFIQLESVDAIHVRHICVEPEHRGNGTAEQLVDHVRSLFRQAGKRAHLVASTPFAEKLAEHAGMKKLTGVIYEGDGT